MFLYYHYVTVKYLRGGLSYRPNACKNTNKSFICKNKGFICVNIDFICTNKSFILILRGAAEISGGAAEILRGSEKISGGPAEILRGAEKISGGPAEILRGAEKISGGACGGKSREEKGENVKRKGTGTAVTGQSLFEHYFYDYPCGVRLLFCTISR